MENEKLTRSEIPAWKQVSFGAISGYLLWTFIYPIVSLMTESRTLLNLNYKLILLSRAKDYMQTVWIVSDR
jgi:hypothetical protein